MSPDDDTRGILRPDRVGKTFTLDRRPPRFPLDRFIDRFWLVTWDLPAGETIEQKVMTHPAVNLVFQDGVATASGVLTDTFVRHLGGRGQALGVMFRPAGFRPLLGRPMTTITDRSLDLADILGPEVVDVASQVDSSDFDAAVQVISDFLEPLFPEEPEVGEEVSAIVELISADPGVTSVSDLADRLAIHPRRLQRLFAEHVGVTPRWVITRARLHAVAEEVKRRDRRSWADLALALGFADQAHMTRRFTDAVGDPPARYARHVDLGTED